MTMCTPQRFPVLYLIGPMAGLPDHGYAEFDKACKWYRKIGYTVLSPHEGAPTVEQIDRAMRRGLVQDFRDTDLYARMMKRDMFYVLQANALIALPDWEHSKGANTEALVAHTIGTPIFRAYTSVRIDDLPTINTMTRTTAR